MLDNGGNEINSRGDNPLRVRRVERLKKKAKKKKWKNVKFKKVSKDSAEADEKAKSLGLNTRGKTKALRPTFGARRASRTLSRIAKRDKK